MSDKRIYEGYAILALQNLGYSESHIQDFLTEFENVSKYAQENEALETMVDFSDGNTRQVVFEGIEIPKEYNMVRISDLFEEHGLMGGDRSYMGKRVCSALRQSQIIYVKDLYANHELKIK